MPVYPFYSDYVPIREGKVKLAKNAVTKKIFFFAKKTAKKFFAIFWGSKTGGFAFCTASGGVLCRFSAYGGLRESIPYLFETIPESPIPGFFAESGPSLALFPYLFRIYSKLFPKAPHWHFFPFFSKSSIPVFLS